MRKFPYGKYVNEVAGFWILYVPMIGQRIVVWKKILTSADDVKWQI